MVAALTVVLAVIGPDFLAADGTLQSQKLVRLITVFGTKHRVEYVAATLAAGRSLGLDFIGYFEFDDVVHGKLGHPTMEMNMTNRKVSHHVKLETSVKIILAVLAIGVMLNAVIPTVKSGTAFASNHCGLTPPVKSNLVAAYV